MNGGLVLRRGIRQQIIVDDSIVITVADIANNQVRLHIAAPKHIRVDRMEVHNAREETKTDWGPD